MMALEAGDYFNFSRFSDIFVDVYRLPESPDYPALLRLTELLMIVRAPEYLVPNSLEMMGLYEKVLRRLFSNSWMKAMPFHYLVLGSVNKQRLLMSILYSDQGVETSSTVDFNQIFNEVGSHELRK